MKNYVKEGQKLPLYGVGPMIVFGMGVVIAIGIILFAYIWKIGVLETPWVLLCRLAGVLLIVPGLTVWFIGALRFDMDASIPENRLQTSGIYAWVRNPMYSGWWLLFAGISLQWHNVWILRTIPANWVILTVTLKLIEEKMAARSVRAGLCRLYEAGQPLYPLAAPQHLRGDRSTCFGG